MSGQGQFVAGVLEDLSSEATRLKVSNAELAATLEGVLSLFSDEDENLAEVKAACAAIAKARRQS